MNKTFTEKLKLLLINTGDMALKRRARRIIEEIDPKPGDRILEIGCGDGYYFHLLSNLGIKNMNLTGVDIDPNAIRAAKKNLQGRKIKLIVSDLMKGLPFASSTFNKVIMSEVAEHLPDDIKGLKEARRVLIKGGHLVLTVPNQRYPLFWDPPNWVLEHLFGIHIKNGFWAGIWNQHQRLYKKEHIEKVVKKAGFNIVKSESLTWWCLPFNHHLMNYAAIKLHSGKLSIEQSNSINKFNPVSSGKPFLITIAYKVVNSIDKLNDFVRPFQNRGVGIIITAYR